MRHIKHHQSLFCNKDYDFGWLSGLLAGLLVLVLVLLQCFSTISEEWETGQVSAWRMTACCFVTKLRGLGTLLLKICTRW
jgi:hypothetical protein